MVLRYRLVCLAFIVLNSNSGIFKMDADHKDNVFEAKYITVSVVLDLHVFINLPNICILFIIINISHS